MIRLLALVGVGVLCASAADMGPFDSELRPMIERYSADVADFTRLYPLTISETRLARLDQFTNDEDAALRALDFGKLSRNGQIDYLLLRNAVQRLRASTALDRRRAAEMEPLVPFYKTIVDLEESRRKM